MFEQFNGKQTLKLGTAVQICSRKDWQDVINNFKLLIRTYSLSKAVYPTALELYQPHVVPLFRIYLAIKYFWLTKIGNKIVAEQIHGVLHHLHIPSLLTAFSLFSPSKPLRNWKRCLYPYFWFPISSTIPSYCFLPSNSTETTCVQVPNELLIVKVNRSLNPLTWFAFLWCLASLFTWFIWCNSISLAISSPLPLPTLAHSLGFHSYSVFLSL